MTVSVVSSVDALLQSEAGTAVVDALVQSNVDPNSVSEEVMGALLREQMRFRRLTGMHP